MVQARREVGLLRIEVAKKFRRVFPKGLGDEGTELEREAMVAIV